METKRYRQCNKIFHMEKCGNTAHTCKCHKKRDNWTVSCPLKGSASLMRCEAVCECVCVRTKICQSTGKLFTQEP